MEIEASKGFAALLARLGVSLATTLVPDRLALIGRDEAGALAVESAPLAHAWGLAVSGDRLAVSTLREIIVYANAPRLAPHHPGRPREFDAFFAPRVSFFTGDAQIHDMALGRSGLVVANTRFSALCAVDGEYSFKPLWRPPFVSALMPDDRCHLNGFALEGQRLAYATAFGAFDTPRGWREHPPQHGVLFDIGGERVLCEGLCLPHSPRLIDGRLYVTEMGSGKVYEIDRGNGSRRLLASLPGLTRGLCSHGGVLFVGLSRPRGSRPDWTLPIDASAGLLRVGIAALDLASGRLLELLEFRDPALREVFDVQVLPGIRRAGLTDTMGWDGLFPIDCPEAGYWMKFDAASRSAQQAVPPGDPA